jgi:hypothetical protein
MPIALTMNSAMRYSLLSACSMHVASGGNVVHALARAPSDIQRLSDVTVASASVSSMVRKLVLHLNHDCLSVARSTLGSGGPWNAETCLFDSRPDI